VEIDSAIPVFLILRYLDCGVETRKTKIEEKGLIIWGYYTLG
jgi:hypothetical protein